MEIKWSDAAYSDWGELRGIREFAAKHALSRRPLVTTLSTSGIGRNGVTEIEFMPTSLHCYTIARNMLRIAA